MGAGAATTTTPEATNVAAIATSTAASGTRWASHQEGTLPPRVCAFLYLVIDPLLHSTAAVPRLVDAYRGPSPTGVVSWASASTTPMGRTAPDPARPRSSGCSFGSGERNFGSGEHRGALWSKDEGGLEPAEGGSRSAVRGPEEIERPSGEIREGSDDRRRGSGDAPDRLRRRSAPLFWRPDPGSDRQDPDPTRFYRAPRSRDPVARFSDGLPRP